NENITPIREPLPAPTSMPPVPAGVESHSVPQLADFGLKLPEASPNSALHFKGGETEALNRLKYYLWDTNLIKTYKETRNGLVGGDYSTKFSPWLSSGCLSPKLVYHEIRRYELKFGANESTYWVFFELLWRDFFRLMAKKHGSRIFLKGGIHAKNMRSYRDQRDLFLPWAEGRTGVPFIDANMRELNATGWMSNRGRQNAASFLVRELKVNWQIGAEYFESMLLDYDPCSNWGNWNYVAGVGSDSREDRYFNILKQARTYDPCGNFVRLWVDELSNVPAEKIHRPDLLTASERQLYKLNNYPKAMVRIDKWES
ncbi:MAG: DASH family cryptochrome, partial [Saprospiraceae bacterium]|nr:DASH family cryptochrome [Saprospiraceae bacterium]